MTPRRRVSWGERVFDSAGHLNLPEIQFCRMVNSAGDFDGTAKLTVPNAQVRRCSRFPSRPERWLGWSLAVWTLLGSLAGLPAAAQVPAPPEELPEVLGGGLRPDAFYVLDEAGDRVMIPGIGFEEIVRLRKVESGWVQPTKPYTFESIAIAGTAGEDRAELSVTIKLKVSPTPGQWISIPLQMEGFHRLGPADVAGVEQYQMDLDPQQGGHLLWVQADQPRNVEVRMRVVTRVVADAGPAIEFHLPAAPTTVSMSIAGVDLSALVVGRGDEVVAVQPGEAGRTTVEVEAGGGNFTLSWRVRDGRRPSDQVLEVESELRLTWDDPQTSPSVVVKMNVHNRRGNIGPFEVAVPAGAELMEPLPPSTSVQLSSRDIRDGRIQVVPDEAQQLSRVEFTLEYRLPVRRYDSDNPLILRGAEVVGAARQSGEIEVRTDRNFRLRWLQQSPVRSAWRTGTPDPADFRVYRFQFDRVPFELPLWLAAKQQLLRVEPEYVVRVGETAITMEATIRATGTVIEGLPLMVDAPGWQTTAVKDAETDRNLDAPLSEQGDGLELELGELASSGGSSIGIRWLAVRPLDPEDDAVRFNLPTLHSADDRTVILAPGTLRIGAEDGLALIVDLQSSHGLTPLPMDPSSEQEADRMQVYQVKPPVGPAPRYEGFLSEDRTEATIDAALELAVVDRSLRMTTDWLITPRGSLRGRLPIEMPESTSAESWEATVDGRPGLLREDEQGEVILYSDDLDNLPRRIRMTSAVPLPDFNSSDGVSPLPEQTDGRFREVRISPPRPALAGGTLNGPLKVRTIESPGFELRVEDRADVAASDDADRQTLTVGIRIRPPEVHRRQIVTRAVLHSEINRTRRYDRLLAQVVGEGDAFQIGFAPLEEDDPQSSETTVRVYVDGQETVDFVETPQGISVSLDPESSHLVDLRLWRSHSGDLLAGMVQPAWKLPVSSGNIYWDVTLASDRHLVWAAPGTSEMMQWRYANLYVHRVATRTYADLLRWMGAEERPELQIGNRYLLVTSDPGSLRFFEAGRPILWGVVASLTLAISCLLLYAPRLRHPLSLIVAAIAVGGLSLLAPALAVIVGQLLLGALGLVAVMLGVHAIITRRPRATVLGGAPVIRDPSTQNLSGRRAAAASEPTSAHLQETVPGSAAGARS